MIKHIMIRRRTMIVAGVAAGFAGRTRTTRAAAAPVKIGNTMPYSGPASFNGNIGKAESALFSMVNDQGGVDGHKIDFISLDDGYTPPRTVEDVRRLLEEMRVDFFFQTLGTPPNSAIASYLNHQKAPQLFVGSGASEWSDYKKYPWTMGWQPNYRTEGQIYAKYTLQTIKNPKISLLYQNDDFGNDYPTGVRDVLGKDWDKYVTLRVTKSPTPQAIRRLPSCRRPAPMCCWSQRFPSSLRSRSAKCMTLPGGRRFL